jgi:hypothetical protein
MVEAATAVAAAVAMKLRRETLDLSDWCGSFILTLLSMLVGLPLLPFDDS